MRKIEILLSVVLIAVGIGCLTMSGSMLFQEDLSFYFETFIKICLWMGLPILIAGVIYLLMKRKRR
ncbi:hypothetical protein [Litchfieldia salsa]|uniref:Uncharacterized protein n=1 Tax=Litchfieldia salsa TaxID=930152 RepID=A0A1H0WT36_9BACI|nr:hypothetical protein [Litchfieldia salsa]SDP93739.1 hypothetical protein SAMN05216565_11528 [Litchfieldia salsa]